MARRLIKMAGRLIKAIFAQDDSEDSQVLDSPDKETLNTTNKSTSIWTSLHGAAVSPEFISDISKILDNPETNVNAKCRNGRTPLHVACRTNSREVVAKLLNDPDVDVNVRDNSGKTPVMAAVEHGSKEALRLMLQDPRVELDSGGNAGKGLNDLEDYSLDFSDWLSCFEMITKEREKRVRNFKPRVKPIISPGWTALHDAAIAPAFIWDQPSSKQRLAKLIRNPETNVNARSTCGETPLHLACRTNYSEAVVKLINVPGIDINACDNTGKTPVMAAVEHGSKEALRLMLQDPRVELDSGGNEGKGLDDLEVIWLSCFEMITKEREKRGRNFKQRVKPIISPGWTALHDAAIAPAFIWDQPSSKQRLAKLIRNPETNVNARSTCGETPLHLACRTNYSEAVVRLINVPGIDVNACDNTGKTPVMVAVEHGKKDALGLMLMDRRVKLDVRSNGGKGLEELLKDFDGDYGEWLECFEMIEKVRKQRSRFRSHQYNNRITVRDVERLNNSWRGTIEDRKKGMKEKMERKKSIKTIYDWDKRTSDLCGGNKELAKMKSKLDGQLNENTLKLTEMGQRKKERYEEVGKCHELMWNLILIINKNKNPLIEDEEGLKDLASLKEMIIQLMKGIRQQVMDTKNEDHHHLEAAKKPLECPICLEMMKPPTRIWMCPLSHLMCEGCKDQLIGKCCPSCRVEKVTLRAFMAEHFAETLFYGASNQGNEITFKLTDMEQRIKESCEEGRTCHELMWNLMLIINEHKDTIMEVKVDKKDEEGLQYLPSLKEMINQLMKGFPQLGMESKNDASDGDHHHLEAAKKTLECPICLEMMTPPTRIWMCPSSHLMCEGCKDYLNGKCCPSCRVERVTLRAFMAEHFAETLFYRSSNQHL